MHGSGSHVFDCACTSYERPCPPQQATRCRNLTKEEESFSFLSSSLALSSPSIFIRFAPHAATIALLQSVSLSRCLCPSVSAASCVFGPLEPPTPAPPPSPRFHPFSPSLIPPADLSPSPHLALNPPPPIALLCPSDHRGSIVTAAADCSLTFGPALATAPNQTSGCGCACEFTKRLKEMRHKSTVKHRFLSLFFFVCQNTASPHRALGSFTHLHKLSIPHSQHPFRYVYVNISLCCSPLAAAFLLWKVIALHNVAPFTFLRSHPNALIIIKP